MGAAVARNWLRAGETVRVWNRTAETAEALAPDGAVVCDTPAACVEGADVVVTVLFDAASVETVVTAAAPAPGTLWLQLSTVGVPGADDLAAAGREARPGLRRRARPRHPAARRAGQAQRPRVRPRGRPGPRRGAVRADRGEGDLARRGRRRQQRSSSSSTAGC